MSDKEGYCESCKIKLRTVPMGKLRKFQLYDENTNTITYKYCLDCKRCCRLTNCVCPEGQDKMWSESIDKKT